jgi:tetratricopeptide (TPR) repeat protein
MRDVVELSHELDRLASGEARAPTSTGSSSPLTPERWRQVEEIFLAALQQPSGAQRAFLDVACAGDPELRGEVEAMLQADALGGGSLAVAVGAALHQWREGERSLIGRRLGPYFLQRELGRGGMGTVYLAVRDDDVYRKEVALKILQRSIAGEHAAARFRHERQILASLEHPYIAQLFDGGSTEDGLPYLVMEHVLGSAITVHCRDRDLSVSARIELFRKVCAAVQHAHQKLVVHRDLKPANILVSDAGHPKLLDFGIAKLLEPGEETALTTRTAALLMTPEYASPEQVRGEPVSAASDVYSLGLILYELLTDERAQAFSRTHPSEIVRVVCETEPRRPSTVAPMSRRRALAGDLDTIVLKAMHKDAGRRYGSVEQLSEDLRRYLAGLPVLARRDTLRYRAAKFVRRNRLAVAAAILVVASLTIGIIVAFHQARRAEARFEQVRALAGSFLFQFHDKIARLEGATEARALLVEKALLYLDSLVWDAADDPSLQLEIGLGYVKLGDVQGNPNFPNLGRFADAAKSYRSALELLRRAAATRDADPAALEGQVNALYGLAAIMDEGPAATRVQLAEGIATAESIGARTGKRAFRLLVRNYAIAVDVELRFGDTRPQIAIAESELEVAQAWARAEGSPEARHALARAKLHLGRALRSSGDPSAAVRRHLEAKDIFEALVREQPVDAAFRRSLAGAYEYAAYAYGDPREPNLGDTRAALSYIQSALRLYEAEWQKDPQDARAGYVLAYALLGKGAISRDLDPRAAREAHERAFRILDGLPRKAEDDNVLGDFAVSHTLLADSLRRLGRRREALQHVREGMEIQRGIVARQPAIVYFALELCESLSILAAIQTDMGDPAGAQASRHEALERAKRLFAARPALLTVRRALAMAHEAAGNLAFARGRRSEARGRHEKSLELWRGWPEFVPRQPWVAGRITGLERALARISSMP